MTAQVLTTLGGLGLFLIGMRMMTDGLRALAGRELRRILRQNTATPLKGAISGALTTAMVQSSSATTVAAVGFVGAGLMSFEQALGIIFGANIGTTITGWLVALIGFKLKLGTALMPVALVGALMRLFAPGRWKEAGWALAGLSVLFFGIDALQAGMAGLRDVISLDRFPTDTILGRLELVGLGAILTVITQSSSAGVASALAALGAGAITFPQAAALVIGMDVGTTFSAALATLGGSTAARRTGFSHVMYNLLTGALAFALLWPLGWIAAALGPRLDPQIALVAFHSAFNVLGVVLVLGVADRFARLVIRLVPERRSQLVAALDPRLRADPETAIAAAVATLRRIARALLLALAEALGAAQPEKVPQRLEEVRRACAETRSFLEGLRVREHGAAFENQIACLHALDHLDRLRLRCAQQERIDTIRSVPELRDLAARLLRTLRGETHGADDSDAEQTANALRTEFRDIRESHRTTAIARAADGEIGSADLGAELDAMRWLQRVSYHLWRIRHHLGVAGTEALSEGGGDEAARADAED